MIKNNKGFSLVELMVVVAIIGVLSAIGIPQITKYMARARQSEAKSNLASVYTANKAFFAEFGAYDNRFNVIGYRPEGRLRYNVGWDAATGQCADLANFGYTSPIPADAAMNARAQCGQNGAMLNGCSLLQNGALNVSGNGVTARVWCGATDKRFITNAAGRVGTGAAIDRWTIDQDKNLRNINDGTN